MNPPEPPPPPTEIDEPPPFLGTWGRVYVAVLLYLALVIGLLYVFSEVYAG